MTGDAAGTLRRWDADTGRRVAVNSGAHRGQIMGIAASPDGSVVATVSADGTAQLWDPEKLTPRGSAIVTGSSGGGDVTFTPDGDRVVVGSGRSISVWDLHGNQLERVEAAEDVIWGVAVSPDGTHLATASADRTVAIRPMDHLTTVEHRLGHSGVATDVAFSADSETLVSTSRSGEVRYWDSRSGELLGEPFASRADRIGEVWRLAFGPKHSHVWFAGHDGDLREGDALDLTVACRLARGLPDQRQRDRFLGGEAAIGCTP
jgi:WD40 repeat protein